MQIKSIFRSGAIVALMAGVAVAGSVPAFAQGQHMTPVIGVLDTDHIIQESLAAKGVNLEREKYANQYQNQIKDEETKLQAEQTNLQNQQKLLAQDVYQQQVQAFQQEYGAFQNQVKDKQERLDYSYRIAMQEIGNTLMTVSQEIAKAQGFNVVMAKNNLMFFDPSMDITAPVLEKLNQRLTSVKFADPASWPRQPAPGQPGAQAGAPAAAAPAPAAAAKKK